ncbi:MAG: glycosyltransferase family 2 protein [Anaerolineales bacterium]
MTMLSVVIPAYNEEDGIEEITNRVLAVQPALEDKGVDELELIVVDDGSRDQTAEIASQIEGVTLVQHPTNRGYGAALKTGFSMSNGDLIGFLDADGTYPPEYFPELCDVALNGADLVIGSRMAGAESEMPVTRRIGNFFFANLISLIGRQRISDSASGMRVFKREVLEKMYPLPDGLNLTPVMSTRALHEDIQMAEVPIPYSERLGRSKLSVVRDGSLFLRSIIWTALSYNPVRIFGLLGLGGVLVSGLIIVGLVVARLSGTTSVSPLGVAALFLALVSAVVGFSFFSLGATFNYLVSLFYKRPIRQGLFGKPIFKSSLERHFGWIGVVGLITGLLLAVGSIILGLTGWDIARLWLYLLGSALLILLGSQLLISWILIQVLAELSERELLSTDGYNSVEG